MPPKMPPERNSEDFERLTAALALADRLALEEKQRAALKLLADGLFSYQILDHSLARLREADVWDALTAACYAHSGLQSAQAVVLLTAEWQRSAWRYRERGYRRSLLDTGHVLGNLVEAAPVFATLAEAVADCRWVLGCTARSRRIQLEELHPREAARRALTRS